MNYKLLSRIFGVVLLMLGSATLSCSVFAWWEGKNGVENNGMNALLLASGIAFATGLILFLIGGKPDQEMLRKEAVVVVGGGWIVSALFGALPFIFCEPSLTFFKALFESMSGFTTTGSTVIPDLTLYPNSILLWRALTQWLGGLGILVLFVALLSQMGVSAKSLFRMESSAHAGEGVSARIKDNAVMFCLVYLALSAITFTGLYLLGMTPFDAVCHTMTTVATGGFSTRNESIAYYHSIGIEMFLTVMMLLSSLSFFFYVAIVRRNWKRVRVEEEARAFFLIVAASILLVTFNLVLESRHYTNVGHAVRESAFHVASIITTTGFVAEDYDTWPGFSMGILLLLMVFGGCAGSTAGGVKISRVLLFWRIARQEVVSSFRPKQVFALTLNGSPAEGAFRAIPIYIAMFAIFVPAGTLLLAILEPPASFDTCLSAVLATLFNVGPGFDGVGPTQTFAGFGAPACVVMTLLMALGRLELYAILVLFVPSLWKKF